MLFSYFVFFEPGFGSLGTGLGSNFWVYFFIVYIFFKNKKKYRDRKNRRRRSNHQTDLGPDPGQAIAQRPDQIGGYILDTKEAEHLTTDRVLAWIPAVGQGRPLDQWSG